VTRTLVPDDALTRFIFSDRDFSASKMLVKERAFRPRDMESETSVFKVTGKDHPEIWRIGSDDVLPERKKNDASARIHARADFNASAPVSIGLKLEFAEPPTDHAVICDWPPERHERILLAQELAARSFLALPSKPIG
jgi:hypothetical protein